MSDTTERAESLRGQLELLMDFRKRMVKLAPIAGSEAVVWVDRLREYMHKELATLEEPPDVNRAARVAWAVLYTIYERTHPVDPKPSVFADAAGLSVRNLSRYRKDAPAVVRKIFGMGNYELRHHWELFADQLELKGQRRATLEDLLLPPDKYPPKPRPTI